MPKMLMFFTDIFCDIDAFNGLQEFRVVTDRCLSASHRIAHEPATFCAALAATAVNVTTMRRIYTIILFFAGSDISGHPC